MTLSEKRAAHAAYMREYLRKPEQALKQKERAAEYYKNNTDRIKNNVAKRAAEKPEEIALSKRKYYESNKELFALKRKEYAESNKDAIAATHRAYYLRNRQTLLKKIREYQSSEAGKQVHAKAAVKYKAANPDKYKQIQRQYVDSGRAGEIARQWREDNPKKVAALSARSQRKRQSLLNGLPEKFTDEQWADLKAMYGNRCLACGSEENLTSDHIVPLSRGGTGDIGNIQPLCLSCNARKGTKSTDFRPTI